MTDYATLQSTVLSRSARSDLAPLVPEFIRVAENVIKREVRVLQMQTTVTLAVPDTGAVALPLGFLGFRSVALAIAPGLASTSEINYMSPDMFHELRENSQILSGVSSDSYYTMEGENLLVHPLPGPGETTTVKATYWQAFEPLADDNTTNWLLTEHFDLYLWATLADLNDHIMDLDMMAKYEAKFTAGVRELHRSERRKQRSGPHIRRPRFTP